MNKNEYLNTAPVKSLIKWIEPKLDTPNSLNHSFYLKKLDRYWECDSLYSAYQQYCWPFSCKDPNKGKIINGISLEDSYAYLDGLSNGLRKSITENDHEGCLKYCFLILEWGGVLNKNNQTIIGLGNDICSYLKSVRVRLSSDMPLNKYFNGQFMNSGFTKIYAQYIDDFIMYDGRVGAALGYLVRMFCEDNALSRVPDELAFAWGRGKESTYTSSSMNRRNPSKGTLKFPELLYNRKLHLENNIRANWLLKGILNNTKSKFNALEQNRQLVALQSALFMIGYDVTGNKTEKSKDEMKDMS